jgi:hypothetical protein
VNQVRLTSDTRGDRRFTRRIDYLISASVRVRRQCSPVRVRRFRSNTNESSSYPMSAFRIGSYGGCPAMWPAGPAAKTQPDHPDDPDASFHCRTDRRHTRSTMGSSGVDPPPSPPLPGRGAGQSRASLINSS